SSLQLAVSARRPGSRFPGPASGAGDVAFDASHRLGASENKFSALNNPARMRRYRRFISGLSTDNARLAVERGRLLLRSTGLSPATPTPSLALEMSCSVMVRMRAAHILRSFRA
ncbi:MAG: hypothetical protein OXN81_16675, partial [Alphaproteobacteria bacterium]|nr:hypothetical protein [Alphaproteobacteria bacterium]